MISSNTKSVMFYETCNHLLQATYAISIEDCGLSVTEWHRYYGDLRARKAVETFAKKYDLQPRSYGLFADTKTRKNAV